MENKQLITICYFLCPHPVRDVSLGRIDFGPDPPHPVRDASLTGCGKNVSLSFSTESCIPNGMPPDHYFNLKLLNY